MGADGHVRIMDYDKFVNDKGLTPEQEKTVRDLIISGQTYLQSFEGRRLITDYWGDNLYEDSTLSQIVSYGPDLSKHDSFVRSELESSANQLGCSPEELAEMMWYLWMECKITKWEVWT
jgi:hypothetical protein